jgi:hypothetical protein
VPAVLDVIHTANLGYGRLFGLSFVHAPGRQTRNRCRRRETKTADLEIRSLGNGEFEVTDRHGKHQATGRVPIIATDSRRADSNR